MFLDGNRRRVYMYFQDRRRWEYSSLALSRQALVPAQSQDGEIGENGALMGEALRTVGENLSAGSAKAKKPDRRAPRRLVPARI